MEHDQTQIATAKEAVIALEKKLETIVSLERSAREITEAIARLKLDELDVLASSKNESEKAKALSKLRLAAEVKADSLKKINLLAMDARFHFQSISAPSP